MITSLTTLYPADAHWNSDDMVSNRHAAAQCAVYLIHYFKEMKMKNLTTQDALGIAASISARPELSLTSGSSKTVADPSTLFVGYDSFMSAPRSTAVKGSITNGGLAGTMSYTVCTCIEDVSSALNISASVSASCGFGSVDAKSDFMRKLKVTATSVHIVAYVSATTATSQYTSVSMADPSYTDANSFFSAYGDSFVNSISQGGEYAAVYSFHSRSVDEQTSVISMLKAHGIGEAGSIDASLQVSLQNAFSSTTTEKSLKQFLRGSAAAYPAPEDIVQFALNFPTMVSASGAVTLSFSTLSYTHVPGFPASLMDDFRKIATNVQLYLDASDGPALSTVYADTYALANSVAAVQDIYSTYAYNDDAALSRNGALVAADLATLKALFTSLENNPTQTVTVPALNSTGWQVPVLNCSLGEVMLSTGGGDQIFTDVSLNNVPLKTIIKSIALKGDKVLDSVAIVYAAGDTSTSFTHGGDGGDGPNTITFGEGERITKITTTYGNVINQISFTTSRSTTPTSWPPNPRGCDYNGSWEESGSTRLLGFSGSCGDYVDLLKVVTVTFSPATFGAN